MSGPDSRSNRASLASAAACAEAERVWLEGTDDPLASARIEAHHQRCARCQATSKRLIDLRADVTRAASPLDDLTRARLLASLAPALDGIAAARARPAHRGLFRRRWPVLTAGAAALAAAAAAFLLIRDPRPAPPVPPTLVALPVPVPVPSSPAPAATPSRAQPAPADVPARTLALLRPLARRPAAGADAAGQPVARIELVDGELHQAALGQQAQLGLRGPALLEVVAASGDNIDLRLVRGTLLVNYDRRHGGRLRIHSPGTVTEVVGTLFSVEVDGEQSRVAVVRGRVAVQVAARSHLLRPGQAVLSDGSDPGPLPVLTRALLHGFQRQVAQTSAAPSASPPPLSLLSAFPSGASATAASRRAVGPGEPRLAAAAVPPPAGPPPADRPPADPAPPATEMAPPVAPAPLVAPTPLPAAARYRLAEAAMLRGAQTEARAHLEALVAESGDDRMAAVARYELAQMALRAGDRPGAARWLDQLSLGNPVPALAESAHFLRCESALGGGAIDEARRCLQTFRAQYPASGNDPLALGLLLRLTPAAELCGPAAAALDQFLRRFPDHRFAAELTARRATCAP